MLRPARHQILALKRLLYFFFAASRVSGNPFSVPSTTQNVQRPTAKLHDQGHDKHHNITDDHGEDSKIGLPYFQLTSCTCPNRLGRDLRFVKSSRSSLVADRPMCSNLLFRCVLNLIGPLALVLCMSLDLFSCLHLVSVFMLFGKEMKSHHHALARQVTRTTSTSSSV